MLWQLREKKSWLDALDPFPSNVAATTRVTPLVPFASTIFQANASITHVLHFNRRATRKEVIVLRKDGEVIAAIAMKLNRKLIRFLDVDMHRRRQIRAKRASYRRSELDLEVATSLYQSQDVSHPSEEGFPLSRTPQRTATMSAICNARWSPATSINPYMAVLPWSLTTLEEGVVVCR